MWWLASAVAASAGRIGPQPLREAVIESLSVEGRGVAHLEGRATFIEGGLPGERVLFRHLRRRGRLDEGSAVTVLTPAPERVEPRCPHFSICGGCSLQHLSPEAQLRHKEGVLLSQLRHIGRVEPETVLAPLRAAPWAYRRKARLSVRHVEKKGGVLVGFMERHGRRVADIGRCEVLDPRVGLEIGALRALIGGLSVARAIPQIEVAVGDSATALVLRNLQAPTPGDEAMLRAFGERHDIDLYLQPGGSDTVRPLDPGRARPLSYRLSGGIEIEFGPLDFTQVNHEVNRLLVDRVVQLLAPEPGERVLDLYCGLGNFTLPLARCAERIVGVEGDAALIARAQANARRNHVDNVQFIAADLTGGEAVFCEEPVERVLMDPPRTGAAALIRGLAWEGVKRVVYVSCDPATLARDSAILVHERGLRLRAAGVLDMFPHTRHVESIAMFEPG